MKTGEYNLAYFNFIRDEITKRVQIHYALLATKFSFASGLFAFLWKDAHDTILSPFLITSISAFLFDIAILENLGWIRSAGHYVKQNIEDDALPVINWERDFAQSGKRWACFHPLGYFLGVWMLGAVLGVGHVVMSGWGITNRVGGFVLVADLCLATYTLFLIRKNLGGRNPPMLSKGRMSPIEKV